MFEFARRAGRIVDLGGPDPARGPYFGEPWSSLLWLASIRNFTRLLKLLKSNGNKSIFHTKYCGPNGLKFCMPFASAILADINMRFSHSLVFSDSTQTQSAALVSMTHPAFKLRRVKPANLEEMRNLVYSIFYFKIESYFQEDYFAHHWIQIYLCSVHHHTIMHPLVLTLFLSKHLRSSTT